MNIDETIHFIQKKDKRKIDYGVVLGSGLGPFVDKWKNPTIIPYKEIPHFCVTSVTGHKGQLFIGEIAGKNIAVMQGRFHKYEGHSYDQVTYPVRVLKKIGINTLILTNSAGGIGDHLKAGDLAYIKDQINFTGKNPLVGKNNSDDGPRFPDMSNIYDKKFYPLIEEAAKELNIDIKSGNYIGVLGPSYETPLEVQFFKTIGADLVGMSTVPEAIVANYLGLKIIGVSCVTNMAAGITKGKLGHDEVYNVARASIEKFSSLIEKIISKI